MRLLLRNWHLKLAALALATILYTGFVFSGSFSEDVFPGVPIQAINQPPASYLVTQQLGLVDIRYRLAADADRVTADSFAVTVDLAEYDTERSPQLQPMVVDVVSLQEGLDVLSWTPSTVSVAIDQLATRDDVPVVVEHGTVPEGLELAPTIYTPKLVTATGPAGQLGLVDRAVARVVIQESGIDISELRVDLVPVDIDGRRVESVVLEPATAVVSIDVQTVETTKTVRIRPVVTGSPAAGFEVGAISVVPAVITLEGTPDALAEITEVTTEPLSIEGATETRTADPEIVVPEDTQLAAGQDASPSVSVQVRPVIITRSFVLGIVCEGVAPDSACLPQLTQLSVTLRGPAATVNGIDPGDLTPVVNVNGLAPGSHDVPPVVTLPEGVELISISPGIVPVVIEGPPTPPPSPG